MGTSSIGPSQTVDRVSGMLMSKLRYASVNVQFGEQGAAVSAIMDCEQTSEQASTKSPGNNLRSINPPSHLTDASHLGHSNCFLVSIVVNSRYYPMSTSSTSIL